MFEDEKLFLTILFKFDFNVKVDRTAKTNFLKKMYKCLELMKKIPVIGEGCEKCAYYNNGFCNKLNKQIPEETDTFFKREGCNYLKKPEEGELNVNRVI